LQPVPCALVACSSKPSFINEYKIDIQQGNVLTQEAVSQLKPGQTRDQVRFLLGTPMVADIFHQQRWDYVYQYKSGRPARWSRANLPFSSMRRPLGAGRRRCGRGDVSEVS
jgi:outer membrane protein assembly factor BamE (lipoprotein component of BamABCDE complex)